MNNPTLFRLAAFFAVLFLAAENASAGFILRWTSDLEKNGPAGTTDLDPPGIGTKKDEHSAESSKVPILSNAESITLKSWDRVSITTSNHGDLWQLDHNYNASRQFMIGETGQNVGDGQAPLWLISDLTGSLLGKNGGDFTNIPVDGALAMSSMFSSVSIRNGSGTVQKGIKYNRDYNITYAGNGTATGYTGPFSPTPEHEVVFDYLLTNIPYTLYLDMFTRVLVRQPTTGQLETLTAEAKFSDSLLGGITVVPAPPTLAMILIGGGLLLRRSRRQSENAGKGSGKGSRID